VLIKIYPVSKSLYGWAAVLFIFCFSSILASVPVGTEVLLVNRVVAGTEVELGNGVNECS